MVILLLCSTFNESKCEVVELTILSYNCSFSLIICICWYTCQTQIIWFSSLFGDKLYVQFHDECWRVPVYDDKCNLMNFSKNTKCLECEELRPKRRLTCSE
ncbi:uncharacterized protein [Rutidosis leptorrhynchoides]|uniref:uncharacterized protein isoform X3 n=1 Tax=Rutidosis leptorrhynchoides TaxID=125765 RepID=UPI003A991073